MSESTLKTLVVHVHYPGALSYFSDWLDAFKADARLDVVSANLATPAGRRRLRRHARDVDLIVLLHSVIGDSLSEVRRAVGPLLDRRGGLVAFIGNEVSLPGQPIAAKIELLSSLKPDIIATQLLLDTAEYLYEPTGAAVLAMPHALNTDAFRSETPNERRPVDIGFRGARYLPHVGDDERNRIIDYFATASLAPLKLDVRTNVSYARRGWAEFLNGCKATIGAESGSVEITRDDSILDRSEVEFGARSSDVQLRARLRPLHRYLPRPVKNALRRTAERLGGRGDPVTPPALATRAIAMGEGRSGKCISSRHFDAIGTETAQILFPGRYNDLLEADRHYFALATDFSNIDDVLARFRDDTTRLQLVRDTRAWAVEHHTYAHRVRSLLDAVGAA